MLPSLLLRHKQDIGSMTAEEQQRKDEQYMRRALDEARMAEAKGEIPIGAVIVCRDALRRDGSC